MEEKEEIEDAFQAEPAAKTVKSYETKDISTCHVDKISIKELEIEITKLKNKLEYNRCNKRKQYACCSNKTYDRDKISIKELEIEITKLRNKLECNRCNKRKQYACCSNKPYDSILNKFKGL